MSARPTHSQPRQAAQNALAACSPLGSAERGSKELLKRFPGGAKNSSNPKTPARPASAFSGSGQWQPRAAYPTPPANALQGPAWGQFLIEFAKTALANGAREQAAVALRRFLALRAHSTSE